MTDREYYEALRQRTLAPLANELQNYLIELFDGFPRIDRISTRAKSTESFIGKSGNIQSDGSPKYNDPINQIQDHVGARILTLYRNDIDIITEFILRYFRKTESRDLVPDSEWEFGYFGRHIILAIPTDVLSAVDQKGAPQFFELQVRESARASARRVRGFSLEPMTRGPVWPKRLPAF